MESVIEAGQRLASKAVEAAESNGDHDERLKVLTAVSRFLEASSVRRTEVYHYHEGHDPERAASAGVVSSGGRPL